MKSTALIPFVLALPLTGQRFLHTHTLAPNQTAAQLRPAGDTNGDGVQDFVARIDELNPTTNQHTWFVQIVSGATGIVLQVLAAAQVANSTDAAGIGDVNGDARSDVAVATGGGLRVFSGSTGALLHTAPAVSFEGYLNVCEAGDFDGNGVPDFIGLGFNNNGQMIARVLRGTNGTQIAAGTPLSTGGSPVATLRSLGDVTGDGRVDIAIGLDSSSVYAIRTDSWSVMWTLSQFTSESRRSIETMDLDGDGRRELIWLRPNQYIPGAPVGTASVYGSNGVLRFVVAPRVGYEEGLQGAACALGDLDSDGYQDFALGLQQIPRDGVFACSGRNGSILWKVSGTLPQFLGVAMTSLADVDADGFGDFAVSTYVPAAGGQWHIVSGRILADAQPQIGACGGGPFFPRLGASRPILGQNITITGLDGPANTSGLLVFSLRPVNPAYLGASSCFAYFDLGAGVALAPLSQPQWSLALPVPLVPQLAGLEVALQSYYAPTSGPLGLDLSNGIWARIGYQ